jgi:hypothetical protein
MPKGDAVSALSHCLATGPVERDDRRGQEDEAEEIEDLFGSGEDDEPETTGGEESEGGEAEPLPDIGGMDIGNAGAGAAGGLSSMLKAAGTLAIKAVLSRRAAKPAPI